MINATSIKEQLNVVINLIVLVSTIVQVARIEASIQAKLVVMEYKIEQIAAIKK